MKKIFILIFIFFCVTSLRAQVALSSFQGTNFTESIGFNGSIEVAPGKYVSAASSANFVMGVSDFTLECWTYPTVSSSSNNAPIISMGYGSNGNQIEIISTSNTDNFLGFIIPNATNTANLKIYTNSNLPLNTWTHLALVRSGLNISLYVNGTERASKTLSTSTEMSHGVSGNGKFWINNNEGNESNYTGNISNIRLVKGTALYTANFTPSTIAPTNVTNTKLLMNTIYGFGNRYLEDISSSPNTISTNGTNKSKKSPYIISNGLNLRLDASVSESYRPPSGGSALFLANKYIDLSPNIIFGTGAYTVEAFVYFPTTAPNRATIIGSESSSVGFSLIVHSSYIAIDAAGFSAHNYNATINANTWYHIVATRNTNGDEAVFVNGISKGMVSAASKFNFSGKTVFISRFANNGNYLKGNLSQLRVVVGSNVYDPTVSSITAPTDQLGVVTNTKLLLKTNSSADFLADASGNYTLTNNAAAEWSSSTPFGVNTTWTDLSGKGNHGTMVNAPTYASGSLEFNGTSQYVSIPNAASNYINGQISIAAWVKPKDLSINSARQSILFKGIGFEIQGKTLGFYAVSGGTKVSSPTFTMSDNIYFHAAVTLNSTGLVSFYINGALIGTAQGSLINLTSQPAHLNIASSSNSTTNLFKGSIANVLMYNKALSSDELATIYNVEKAKYGL
jgi:hypothetical protein